MNYLQSLTNEELQRLIDLYQPLAANNSIAGLIVEQFQWELNERTNQDTNGRGNH